ncbi:hypothetical protein ALI144C_16735 [Actinosynnema sp. ALI-1.44]|uniref:hypothetical protein n=1 Tax=Actinosynnema sp. ALI-1.44 TaxID=1933779 RepID=UPI00097CB313|nr:hypothetical protein [Actinosynnema sp. ALI-1.44]ONI83150.1 hypothetical protein ALI144C_16735 [Actinosynnema sp. ALI-1.44]
MRDHSTTVDSWLGLAHADLTEHVRKAVRGGSATPDLWSEVATHPVLAARVRGILSALQSQMADHRDHAMWTAWTNRARKALDAPQPAPVEKPKPAAPAPAQELPAFSVATATAAPPPKQAHVVPPVTFQAAGQVPSTTAK